MKRRILLYNWGHDFIAKGTVMPKRKVQSDQDETFGQRMARFRKDAGYSQRELAAELGIAQRMIAYYEKQTEHPPTHLLPLLARTLRVSADELLGIQKPKPVRKTRDTRLWRRFSQIEKMGQQERRQVLQVLDAFIEREQLKKKAAAG
jgi:transcriptional regulator with XRE-family HTH domain